MRARRALYFTALIHLRFTIDLFSQGRRTSEAGAGGSFRRRAESYAGGLASAAITGSASETALSSLVAAAGTSPRRGGTMSVSDLSQGVPGTSKKEAIKKSSF